MVDVSLMQGCTDQWVCLVNSNCIQWKMAPLTLGIARGVWKYVVGKPIVIYGFWNCLISEHLKW